MQRIKHILPITNGGIQNVDVAKRAVYFKYIFNAVPIEYQVNLLTWLVLLSVP